MDQIPQYHLHLENITVVFNRHSGIGAAFFFLKGADMLANFSKCGMQGPEGRVRSRPELCKAHRLIKNADLAKKGKKGRGLFI